MRFLYSCSSFIALILLVLACNGGPQTTADGGVIYTSLPPDSIACTVDTDCCVVTDSCRSAAYVVHAGDTVQMPKPSSGCNLCIGPAVQVWCKNNVCQSGVLSNLTDGIAPFLADHCGTLPIPDGGDGTIFAADGGIETMAAYGCDP